MEHSGAARAVPLAIIGLGCRLPGADGVAAYWDALLAGADAVRPVPPDRFDVAAHYDPRPGVPGRTASRHGGFLDGLHEFDAAFFGISPAEARSMDPQQRLLLQVAWETVESAGILPSSLAGGRVGVFVGQATAEYGADGSAGESIRAAAGSRLRAVTAGRLSHALDLRGPSVVVDTACSSSLVAVHLARQSLLTGESDLALAAGVNVILSAADAVTYSGSGMLSPGGRCRFGDRGADGFVRSEGVAAVLLKRLPDALRDDDPITALLLGSAVTNDGRASGLLLQPSVAGQVRMLRDAWATAGVGPAALDYLEAHGTGTSVGDEVELRALREALGAARARVLPVGSAKSNLGHTEAAAGLAGLVKAALVARHRLVPATLHLTDPHPLLAGPDSPLRPVRAVQRLEPAGAAAVVGVSSFGISGTNAHAVIGEYRPEVHGVSGAMDASGGAVPAGGSGVSAGVTAGASGGGASTAASAVSSDGAAGGVGGAVPVAGAGVSSGGVARASGGGASAAAAAVSSDGAAGGVGGAVPVAGAGVSSGGVARASGGGASAAAAAVSSGGAAVARVGGELLVLSARSRAALLRLAGACADHLLGAGREFELGRICATAALRREAHPWRLWVRGRSHEQLAERLRLLAAGEPTPDGGYAEAGYGGGRRVVFVLPGQGAQWLGMGRGLLAASPAFRAALTACDRAVREELGCSVMELLQDESLAAFPERVSVVQPALWAVQVALAAAWAERGVSPDGHLGHSMGEVAAAQLAGALPLADAAAVICRRSRLMETAPAGGMLVVALDAGAAERALAPYGGRLCVAAHNAPGSTVVAGELAALDDLVERLTAGGVGCHRVKVAVASHSPQMDGPSSRLAERLGGLTVLAPTGGLYSTVRQAPVVEAELDATYWAANLREPVRFTESVRALAEQAETVFVELGPHPVLVPAVTATLAAHGLAGAALGSVRADRAEPAELTRAVGRLFAAGGTVDWTRWYPASGVPVPLPAYPWERTVHRADTAHLRETDLAGLGAAGWAGGLRVRGLTPVPAVVHLATVLDMAHRVAPEKEFALERVELGPGAVDSTGAARLRIRLDAALRHAVVEADGVPCARAELVPLTARPVGVAGVLDESLARCREYLTAGEFDALALRAGFEIGAPYRAVRQVWRRDGEAVARLRRPSAPAPAVWESGLLTLLAAWPGVVAGHPGPVGYLPEGFERVELHGELTEEYWAVASFTPELGLPHGRGDLLLLAPDGAQLAAFRGIRLRPLAPQLAPVTAPAAEWPSAWPEPAAEQRRPERPWGQRPVAEPEQAGPLVVRAARLLGMRAEEVDDRRALRDLGLDSLMASQLRQQLAAECGIEVGAQRLLGPESLAKLRRELEGPVPQPV
ncbi:type I polyketide synthase [Kitasatospora sp. MMS16-BH015]|uniref:type I polyketide synthase n=1 Tax=Kitasatospora sp. MMS16-BH015 TaxID=2018025 RepID=UPI000CA31587|nr:type I polyketide synthase [Kitasatospora sp. MMS16-BH015]AUG80608.1 type I polyketide synthase [Kitasatospora sp. MMS16-BH015]